MNLHKLRPKMEAFYLFCSQLCIALQSWHTLFQSGEILPDWTMCCPYRWVLLLLQVLSDIRVEMLCVSFVQTVDLSLLLDPHVFVSEYKLTDGLHETRYDEKSVLIQSCCKLRVFRYLIFIFRVIYIYIYIYFS